MGARENRGTGETGKGRQEDRKAWRGAVGKRGTGNQEKRRKNPLTGTVALITVWREFPRGFMPIAQAQGLCRLVTIPTVQHMITVTAGILSDGDRVLICQRRAGSQFPLKWEFPGGKIEEGESPEACLHRELSEELAIEAEVGPEIYRTEHRYPSGFAVRLLFFRIMQSSGTPTNHAFERIEWVRQADLCAYDFLEADRELIERMVRGEVT